MPNAQHDQNHVPTLTAVSNADGVTIVALWADPVTHRLLVDATGGGGGTTLKVETPSGTVDDSNTTFTVANTPVFIVINGGTYVAGTGLFSTYSAPTITLSSPVGTGGFIRSFYNG